MENTVAAQQARRDAQHASMTSQVVRDVNADIAVQAGQGSVAEAGKIGDVAGAMRGKAIADLESTDREFRRSRALARGSQVVDFAFMVLYSLLAIRLVLALIAARSSSGFVQLINVVTAPFYLLFRGIVSSPSTDGGYTLAVPLIIALGFYALLHAGIKALLRLIANRRTEI